MIRYQNEPDLRFDISAKADNLWTDVDYKTLFEGLPQGEIKEIGIMADKDITLRGLSLINQPTKTSRSVLFSTNGNYRFITGGDVKIYENLAVLPRAFIVHQMEVVSDVDTAIAKLRSPDFDVSQTIVKVTEQGEETGNIIQAFPETKARVEIVTYQPERIEMQADLDAPGWLVVSDTAYPGWRAEVNGREVPILEVDIMLRAVALSSGSHQVVLSYQPKPLYLGGWLSLCGGLLGMLILILHNKQSNNSKK